MISFHIWTQWRTRKETNAKCNERGGWGGPNATPIWALKSTEHPEEEPMRSPAVTMSRVPAAQQTRASFSATSGWLCEIGDNRVTAPTGHKSATPPAKTGYPEGRRRATADTESRIATSPRETSFSATFGGGWVVGWVGGWGPFRNRGYVAHPQRRIIGPRERQNCQNLQMAQGAWPPTRWARFPPLALITPRRQGTPTDIVKQAIKQTPAPLEGRNHGSALPPELTGDPAQPTRDPTFRTPRRPPALSIRRILADFLRNRQ